VYNTETKITNVVNLFLRLGWCQLWPTGDKSRQWCLWKQWPVAWRLV